MPQKKVDAIMITITQVKKLALALAIPGTVALLVATMPTHARTDDTGDAGAMFKTKCVACHGGNAEKRFDGTKPDDQLVETILKGRKAEKPPNMPSFEEKGITADQAKALVAHMKLLKH